MTAPINNNSTSTSEKIATCPSFSQEDTLLFLKQEWNINKIIKPLDSYLDQNFLAEDDLGKKYVVKISNIETPEIWLDLQNKVLEHLESAEIPKSVSALSGVEILVYKNHFWRVLEFLEGTMFSIVPFRSDKLLNNIGSFAGNFSKQMSSFNHVAAERPIQWDLQHAQELIAKWILFIDNQEVVFTIQGIIKNWETKQEEIKALRKSVIHGDLTRYNILLDQSGEEIQGIIDFGDVCYSWTIGELAVLILESVMTGSPTPFQDAHKVIATYHKNFPLQENEIELLYSLIQLRSAIIVCASARQLSMEPDNDYVRKQAIVDQEMFHKLAIDKNDFATVLFLDACQFKISNDESSFLKINENSLFKNDLILKEIIISPFSDIFNDGAWTDNTICKKNILDKTENGFGYAPYCSTIIKPSNNNAEAQTIILGVFVFAPIETIVFAPSDLIFIEKNGKKSVFKWSQFFVIIYGLSHDFQVNDAIKIGSVLGTVFEYDTTSMLPSNLGIQITKSDNVPLFCLPSEKKGWNLLIVDPSKYLGLASKSETIDSKSLLERRSEKIQQAQEYYYQSPMNLVRGWKQYLIDDNGQVYLDAINNVAHIGHSHPKVSEAAFNQLNKLNTNARFLYEDNILFAEKLLKFFPESLQVIFFTCTGSEANDLALRLARAYTNEKDVIVIDGEYHGNTTAVDEISTNLMDNPTASKSVRTFTHPLIQPNTFRGKYTEKVDDVATLYANDVHEKISFIQSEGRGIAAFISESLLGSGGGVEMPKGYLEKVYQAVHNAGGVCIADEVQIGFGRMGSHFWGFEKEGVLPDIVTLGKPMGNGFPIAAVVTTKKIADAYKEKYTYFNTYAGNPVACQVATAVIDTIIEENLQQNAVKVGGFLKSELEKLMDDFDCIGAIYGHAMYLGVDLVTSKKSRKPDSQKALWVCEAMKNKGIIIYPTGDHYNILKIKPPMCFTKENASFVVENLKEILSTMDS
jgi:4-aminobutyrate aminotransferase-like enzyme/Ser/Thr protein kinase RdoA (MazF antagonist)